MAEWLFDKGGHPCLILDGNCVRDKGGYVIGWIIDPNVYSSTGQHIGWLEGGIIYDINNFPLVFSRNHTGSLPYNPGLTGTSSMPGFTGTTGRPGFQGTRGKPGRSNSWSKNDPLDYF